MTWCCHKREIWIHVDRGLTARKSNVPIYTFDRAIHTMHLTSKPCFTCSVCIHPTTKPLELIEWMCWIRDVQPTHTASTSSSICMQKNTKWKNDKWLNSEHLNTFIIIDFVDAKCANGIFPSRLSIAQTSNMCCPCPLCSWRVYIENAFPLWKYV